MTIEWPDLVFPPINLWNYPRTEKDTMKIRELVAITERLKANNPQYDFMEWELQVNGVGAKQLQLNKESFVLNLITEPEFEPINEE
jgi:hypothetical protein